MSARVIAKRGSDELGIAPEFDALSIRIRIANLVCGPIETLEDAAFAGSSPDVFDRESLVSHLQGIYATPLSAFRRLRDADRIFLCRIARERSQFACAGAGRVPRRWRWRVVALLLLALCFNYFDRQMIAILKPTAFARTHWTKRPTRTSSQRFRRLMCFPISAISRAAGSRSTSSAGVRG